jgi:hypothetical protein
MPVFVFAPSSVERKKQGENLRQLASQSGGRVYFLPGDPRQDNFDVLKRDLAQSFLLQVAVPGTGGNEMLPVTITNVSDSSVQIVAPAKISVPR